MWLGECGYVPGVDELLREAAIRYFFVDTHGILFADRRPVYGVYAPIYCPSGVAAFGRDMESSEQVWSAKEGYPGDPHYRDFYRDIGFDLPLDYIGPYIHPEGHRVYTGIKYHAITHDQLHDKWVYDPDIARGKAGLHAVALPRQPREAGAAPARRTWIGRRSSSARTTPSCTATGGTRGRCSSATCSASCTSTRTSIETITPGDYLDRHDDQPGGDAVRVVVGLQGLQRLLAERDQRLDLPPPARRRPSAWSSWRAATRAPTALTTRALNQAARELMLAQSTRLDVHHEDRHDRPLRHQAHQPAHPAVQQDSTTTCARQARGRTSRWLADVEARDNIFPNIDYRIYAS